MRRTILAAVGCLLITALLAAFAGCSAKDLINSFKGSRGSPTAAASGTAAARSSAGGPGAFASAAGSGYTAGSRQALSGAAGGIDSTAQNIEQMLNGIANDTAGDSDAASVVAADSIISEINRYLNQSVDDTSGLG